MSETGLVLPPAIREIATPFAQRGHDAAWVGGCVRDHLRGCAVHDFDLCVDAATSEILELFPRGVPIGFDTVMVPTRAGPVDVTPWRAADLTGDLARRDFTVNAIAWNPHSGAWCDPFGGREDLRRGVLHPVGDPAERLREDPLRALRAARFVATLGLEPVADLGAAIRDADPSFSGVARERIRRELERLLLGDYVAEGLAFLRESGVEARVAPALADLPLRPWIRRLPKRLDLRLSGWLAGTDPQVTLGPLRFGEARIAIVARRVSRHPLDTRKDWSAPGRLRHLLAKVGEDVVEDLLLLREAETGEPQDAQRAALDDARRAEGVAIRREDLALDGRAVMEILGAEPGRRVGAAIRYLLERVLDDPALNTETALRRCLEQWQQENR